MRAGARETVDALLRPGALEGTAPGTPGAAFREALSQWPGTWYWADRARTSIVLVRALPGPRPRWALHTMLFVLTLICALGAGAVLAGSWVPTGGRGLLGTLVAAGGFFAEVGGGAWGYLLQGFSFGAPLLLILLVHELGHYLAARHYAIDVSPPWFIPVPPTLSPIGSLGAFIRLRSPVLDRRQLMDVGAAGPLAGFLVALLVLAWGYTTSERIAIVVGAAPSYVTLGGTPLFLGESLLTGWLRDTLLPGTAAVHLSAPAFAGWVGMFVTGLNLLPLSQLDGGHVLYSLFGKRQGVIGLAAILGLLWLAQESPTWYVWVVLALVVGRGSWAHPSVLVPERPVPFSRQLIGWLSLAVFVLTFAPRPFL